jgi:hypothetical protein
VWRCGCGGKARTAGHVLRDCFGPPALAAKPGCDGGLVPVLAKSPFFTLRTTTRAIISTTAANAFCTLWNRDAPLARRVLRLGPFDSITDTSHDRILMPALVSSRPPLELLSMSQAQRQKRKTVSRINFDEDAGFPAKKRTKVDTAANDVNSASTRRKNQGV